MNQMFGESWDAAIAANKVYNAKDAAVKLGIDGAGINDKWSQLKRGENLIKFGGGKSKTLCKHNAILETETDRYILKGFYCGKIDDIYVMNGFYMSMRAAYCNEGEKIKWYTVSWPTDSLAWESFRGEVLGATDPSTAPKGEKTTDIGGI